jgi:hypothetical protein
MGHEEDISRVIGNRSGPAIVIGSAACMWDDLSQVADRGDYIAVNHAGLFVHYGGAVTQGRLVHWASLHSDLFPAWRHLAQVNQGQHINWHTNAPDPNSDFCWQFNYRGITRGSSALFAVFVGLALGYNPVILAGCPLDNSPPFYGKPGTEQATFAGCIKGWEQSVKLFNGRVKSMSGRTRELLGAP